MKRIEIPITNEKKVTIKEEKLREYNLSQDAIRLFRAKIKIVSHDTSTLLGYQLFQIISDEKYDESKDLSKVIDLILRGADINQQYRLPSGVYKWPIVLSIKRNYFWTSIALIRAGADINVQDEWELNTPLMFTIISNQKEMFEILLLMGANKDIKNKYWDTPISFTKKQGYTDYYELLTNTNTHANGYITENDPDALIKETEARLKEITEEDNSKLVKKKSSFKRIY